MADRKAAYRRGRQFEYRVRDRLRKLEYVVVRAAGSKGVIDMVAMAPGQVLLVQCKLRGAISSLEWNELLETARQAGGTPVLVSTNPVKRGLKWVQPLTARQFRKRGSGTQKEFCPGMDATSNVKAKKTRK